MTMIEILGSIGGVGAVMGFLIFVCYKTLVKQMTEEREHSETRLTGLLKDYNEVCRQHSETQVKHTQVLTELYTYLKMRNGNPK